MEIITGKKLGACTGVSDSTFSLKPVAGLLQVMGKSVAFPVSRWATVVAMVMLQVGSVAIYSVLTAC